MCVLSTTCGVCVRIGVCFGGFLRRNPPLAELAEISATGQSYRARIGQTARLGVLRVTHVHICLCVCLSSYVAVTVA